MCDPSSTSKPGNPDPDSKQPKQRRFVDDVKAKEYPDPKSGWKAVQDEDATQASDANTVLTDQIRTLQQDQEKILAMLLDERKQRQALEARQSDNATVHSNFPSSPGTFATTASNQELWSLKPYS